MSNKAFTKTGKIVLDSNWDLTPDSDNGVILTFSEIREREKTKKEGGKTIKTGEFEDFLFTDRYFYPRLVQALRKYYEITLNNSETFKEIIEKEDKIIALLEKIDYEFKQF